MDVLAADVYAVPPHVGLGGWTWYTSSAAWMYRLLTESLPGVSRRDDMLEVTPCVPPHWPQYSLNYCCAASAYRIEIHQVEDGDATLQLDGVAQAGLRFKLLDDASAHRVEIRRPKKYS